MKPRCQGTGPYLIKLLVVSHGPLDIGWTKFLNVTLCRCQKYVQPLSLICVDVKMFPLRQNVLLFKKIARYLREEYCIFLLCAATKYLLQ